MIVIMRYYGSKRQYKADAVVKKRKTNNLLPSTDMDYLQKVWE
uniref:Uncharacterized protein n=1 Tax=Rhizophora mucronata TaxID=61149 RepID=A0A2P2PSE7_RHIMU